MLKVERDGRVWTDDDYPPLRLAERTLRMVRLSAEGLHRMRVLEWAEARAVYDRLPPADLEPYDASAAWDALRSRPGLLGLDRVGTDAGVQERLLTARGMDATDAGLTVDAWTMAAAVAVAHPLEWREVMIHLAPSMYRRGAHPAWDDGLWPVMRCRVADPSWMPGVSGVGLAWMVEDCMRVGRWRATEVCWPDGHAAPMPDAVWDWLERHGHRHCFDPLDAGLALEDEPEF